MALCLKSYQCLYQVVKDKDKLDFVTHEGVSKLGTWRNKYERWGYGNVLSPPVVKLNSSVRVTGILLIRELIQNNQ